MFLIWIHVNNTVIGPSSVSFSVQPGRVHATGPLDFSFAIHYMSGFGTPPVIPASLQPSNSDPQWQVTFSTIWSSALGFFVLISAPRIIRAVKSRRGVYAVKNWVGFHEDHRHYHDVVSGSGDKQNSYWQWLGNGLGILNAFLDLTIPGVDLTVGQVILLLAYTTTVAVCIVQDSQIIDNPNRPGDLAQLPVVFLFASKHSIVSVLLGPGVGYEKLNFLHRWSGRVLFVSATVHGSLWIRNNLSNGLPILGQEKETTGIVSFSFLALIVLGSLRPARAYFYQFFYSFHLVFSAAFYIAILYHTSYAIPWTYPPLAIYGLDILLRMLKCRFTDGVLIPVGDQMTLVHVPHITSGWLAGQHVRLRIFFSGRLFESHPFTTFTATPDISCITSMPIGLSLGVRAVGDWSIALNKYANKAANVTARESESRNVEDAAENESRHSNEVPIQLLLDGPYGGCSVDLGDYETVLLFSGGSGITFALGLLDDIVGRCLRKGRRNGEKTKRIELAWCLRSFGQLDWFSSAFMDIATICANSTPPLYLHISIYVTCLCNPEAIPPIPNCDVVAIRPSIYQLLVDIITPPNRSATASLPGNVNTDVNKKETPSLDANKDLRTEIVVVNEDGVLPISEKLPWVKSGGGLAVCASGPASLTTETANAVSRIQMSKRGRDMGLIGLHTEVFSL